MLMLSAVLTSACQTPTEPILEENPDAPPMEEPVSAMDETRLSSIQTFNEDGTVSIALLWNGETIETVEGLDNGEYEVVLFEENEEYAYIAINYSGLGGYILYGGAHSLYQLDLRMQTVRAVFEMDQTDGIGAGRFVTDVSPDNTSIVVFSRNEAGQLTLETKNISDYMSANGSVDVVYLVDEEFTQAGDAVFSPDSMKLAYAASLGLGDFGEGYLAEETAVFVIDFDTGIVQEIERVTGLLDITWESGEEPTVTQL